MSHAQLIVAHRGSSDAAPENTIAAFELAWQQQADAIEGDFYLTRDQRIVCIHDPTTLRVAGIERSVAESNWDDLRNLDIGSWKHPNFANERIPPLSEVLATVPEGKQILMEIKCGPEIIPALKHELSCARIMPIQTVVMAFDQEVIRAVKEAMPDRPAFWLSDFHRVESDNHWIPSAESLATTAKSLGANGVGVCANPQAVTSELIVACRAVGLHVNVWTVNEVGSADYFHKLGVDSMTTNRPDVMRRRFLRP